MGIVTWIQFLHCVFYSVSGFLNKHNTNDVFLIDREQGNLLEEWSCCFNGNHCLMYGFSFHSLDQHIRLVWWPK